MKQFKKITAVLLAVLMIFSSTVLASSAKSDYVADYDTETPVIIVHGMSQNNTYLVDENGEWAKDNKGNYMTAWPLKIDVPALLKTALIPLLKAIVFRKDMGLADALYKAAHEALWIVEKDTKGNYTNNVVVPCYECPMSELSPEVKEEYYKFLPIQELSEIVGEDNVYYFGYDSLGDVISITDHLNYYIHNVVLPQTGAKQVKICSISLGGTIAVRYLDKYPEDYKLIKKVVFVEPALDGSNIIGDLLTDNLSFYNEDDLYENVIVGLLGDTYLSYLINMVLRILPKNVLMNALRKMAAGVVDIAARNSTIIWALCPTAYYEEARAIWLQGKEYDYLRAKVDDFMASRSRFKDNLFALMDTGCIVGDVACYDVNLFPICKDYKTTNADRVIHAASTTLGVTFADLGTTLGENYKAKGTYCSNPQHNHLSPDGMVDTTTGLLPCSTWLFKGQAHELLPHNDVALKLAIRIMTDNNMVDVYSNPEAYPQFNNGRLTNTVKEYMLVWDEADKSAVSAEDKAAIEAAIAEVNALLDETVVDAKAWADAEAKLGNTLAAAGIIEDPNPSKLENALTVITKNANRVVNKAFKYIEK